MLFDDAVHWANCEFDGGQESNLQMINPTIPPNQKVEQFNYITIAFYFPVATPCLCLTAEL